jgi:hypothetical protein
MRLEELGIDPKTGRHQKQPLTHMESCFVGLIWVDHVGRESALPGREFCTLWCARMGIRFLEERDVEEYMRDLRTVQNHLLIEHNVPVYSAAGKGGGYWIGESREEGDEFYGSFRKRGLTGMVKASRGKRSAMVDMVEQLAFQFDELVDKTMGKTADGRPQTAEDGLAPIEIVDVFLKKMTQNPAQFSEGLKKLGEKYGSVLVPRDRFDAMITAVRTKAAELQELARGLEQ